MKYEKMCIAIYKKTSGFAVSEKVFKLHDFFIKSQENNCKGKREFFFIFLQKSDCNPFQALSLGFRNFFLRSLTERFLIK